jgi:hypothetical protein
VVSAAPSRVQANSRIGRPESAACCASAVCTCWSACSATTDVQSDEGWESQRSIPPAWVLASQCRADAGLGGAAGPISDRQQQRRIGIQRLQPVCGAGVLAAQAIGQVGHPGDAGADVAPAARSAHTEAQPSGLVGLSSGTSVPGTERDTDRIELDSHWNSSRKRNPLSRNGLRTEICCRMSRLASSTPYREEGEGAFFLASRTASAAGFQSSVGLPSVSRNTQGRKKGMPCSRYLALRWSSNSSP